MLVKLTCIFLACLAFQDVCSLPLERERRSDDGGPLEVVVQQLSQQVTSLTAQLTSVNSEITALKAKTATLDKTVAFYASSTDTHVKTTPHGTIILNNVLANVGNGYSPLTGVFTVPVSGVYDFQLTVMSSSLNAEDYINVMVDGVWKNILVSDTGHGEWDQVTARVILHVNQGQNVYAYNGLDAAIDFHGPYTSFSGFLIKAD